jgi:hypothetical protein
MTFFEELPEQCPPANAMERELPAAYRVVTNVNPDMEDFKSYAARKVKCPDGFDPCRWASCSLFLSRDRAIEIAMKLPKPRFKKPFIATMSITAMDGVSLVKKNSPHVDFWMYSNFDPLNAIVETESVNGT